MSSRTDVIARLRAAGCVFAEDEADLLLATADSPLTLARWLERRVDGEPLETVVGFVEFCGRRVLVDPGVFVPRQRTALLAREAVARTAPHAVVVDLCCGVGAVAAVVATAVPSVRLHAADVDPAAVICARRNLAPFGASVLEGDLFDPLPPALRGRIDVLTCNAPYVPTEAIAMLPPEARDHEPLLALDGGDDGLAVLRRVVAGAARWLAPSGSLLVETGTAQAPLLCATITAAGLSADVVRDDELGATVVVASRP